MIAALLGLWLTACSSATRSGPGQEAGWMKDYAAARLAAATAGKPLFVVFR
jgi:hypothetical protein